METTVHNQLTDILTKLKLSQFNLFINEVVDKIVTSKISVSEGLLELAEKELEFRESNTVKSVLKTAGLPHALTIDSFDFNFQPSINELEIRELLNLGFIENGSNIILSGSSGTGKTMLACIIGTAAANKRFSMYYIKLDRLIQQLTRAKAENKLENKIRNYAKYKLLIIDEWGHIEVSRDECLMLFRLIDARYEKKSTIITTNLFIDDWDRMFHGKDIFPAIKDRVLHHAKVIHITGKSYRTRHLYAEEN